MSPGNTQLWSLGSPSFMLSAERGCYPLLTVRRRCVLIDQPADVWDHLSFQTLTTRRSVNIQKKTHTWMIKCCGLLSWNKPKKHPAQTEHGSPLLLSWLQWLLLASVECVERQTFSSGVLLTYKIGNGAIKTCGQASSHTGNSERAHPTQTAFRSPESLWVFSEAWTSFFHVSFLGHTKDAHLRSRVPWGHYTGLGLSS